MVAAAGLAALCVRTARGGVSVGWRDVAARVSASAGCVTLCLYTWRLAISGYGVNVELVVDVVGRNVSSPYGAVVHGVGAVEPGGVAYTARSVSGVVGSRGLRLSAGGSLW